MAPQALFPGKAHPTQPLPFCGQGGGHTPGSRGPQPGGADCPHPYTRDPATGHLTPQLWTEPPSMQGQERPHTRALHPLEALQDPTSDPALDNAPVQGHQGQLTPLSGTPARRPSWGSPPPQPLSSALSATRGSKDTGLLTSTGFHLHLPSPDPSPEHALLPPDSPPPPRISESVLSGAPCSPAGQSLTPGCRTHPSPAILFRPSNQETTHRSLAGPALRGPPP